ncbi:hypothetical protein ACFZBU_40190 [Embleya sp. NPDC008237]|uniref:hypothetical protein n=1 Tax=Embleya sp. NPDC008237 TaxID=3363978 RepID=UPI0036E1981E
MSVDVDGVYAAARKVHPYTADLMGPHAAQFEADLAAALADPPSETGAEHLKALFGRRRATRTYLSSVLADAPLYRPPGEQEDTGDVRGGPVGDADPVAAVSTWKCSACGRLWHRPDAALPVPPCHDCGHAPLDRVVVGSTP